MSNDKEQKPKENNSILWFLLIYILGNILLLTLAPQSNVSFYATPLVLLGGLLFWLNYRANSPIPKATDSTSISENIERHGIRSSAQWCGMTNIIPFVYPESEQIDITSSETEEWGEMAAMPSLLHTTNQFNSADFYDYDVNPATGLPMLDGAIDIAGNPMGIDLSNSFEIDNSFDFDNSGFNNDFGSGFDDDWH